jgi:SprT protein
MPTRKSDTMKTLERKIENRVLDLLALMADLGLELEVPEIRFTLTGRVAGYCTATGRGKECVLKFNLEFMERYESDFLKYTVSHEVAHYVVFTLYDRDEAKPHGEEWKRVMRIFGVKRPLRCHSYCEAGPTKGKPWVYRCKCQTPYYLSNVLHKRILKGTHYHCNKCKCLIKFVERGFLS